MNLGRGVIGNYQFSVTSSKTRSESRKGGISYRLSPTDSILDINWPIKNHLKAENYYLKIPIPRGIC